MSLTAYDPAAQGPAAPQYTLAGRLSGKARDSVPRAFQVAVVVYVLLTGELTTAIQAALFGLVGGGGVAFTAAFMLALAVDAARLAPLFVLARHPLGILHPLVVVMIVWPILREMPVVVDQLGGFTGLLLGAPVHAPFFRGLGWGPAPGVWWSIAYYNALELLSLVAIYCGFAFLGSRPARATTTSTRSFDPLHVRRIAIFLVILCLLILSGFLYYRGGIVQHLADLSRGRFVALAGLGPMVALVDIGTVALIIWIAARPQDAKSPLFICALLAVAGAQFMSNGSRSSVLNLFIMVALTWSFRLRKVPWRLALMALPAFILALGLLNIVRNAGWQGQTAGQAIGATDTAAVLERVQTEAEVRRSIDGSVPVVMDGQRVMGGPMFGQTYVAALFGLVPRSIWPEKPRGPGSLYAQHFLGAERDGTGVPIGATAEAHWNFGVLGVAVLSLLYGLLIKRMTEFYFRKSSNPFVLALFIIFASTFQMITESIVLFIQQLILLGGAYLLTRFTSLGAKAPEVLSAAEVRRMQSIDGLVARPPRLAGE